MAVKMVSPSFYTPPLLAMCIAFTLGRQVIRKVGMAVGTQWRSMTHSLGTSSPLVQIAMPFESILFDAHFLMPLDGTSMWFLDSLAPGVPPSLGRAVTPRSLEAADVFMGRIRWLP